MHDMAVDISQTEVTSLITVRQPSMVNSQQMQDRGIEIMNVHGAGRPRFLVRR